MVKNLNLSPQAMYFWPKMGQNGQNENFPRHKTTVKWLKAIAKSDAQFRIFGFVYIRFSHFSHFLEIKNGTNEEPMLTLLGLGFVWSPHDEPFIDFLGLFT